MPEMPKIYSLSLQIRNLINMVYYSNKKNKEYNSGDLGYIGNPPKFYKDVKKVKKAAIIFLAAVIFLYSGFVVIKASSTFDAISGSKNSLLKSIIKMLPFGDYFYKPEEKAEPSALADISKIERLNILLLGMRGENDEANGGLLTDTIMLLSIKPKTGQVAMISIPRDIYLQFPGYNIKRKINEAYEVGEIKNYPGGGLAYAKKVISEVTGIEADYAANIDFIAFQKIIDAMGGITIELDKPFEEPIPFAEGKISLPAGKSTINGAKALLFSRARFSTSDFDRARRQQKVLLAIKEKALSSGILLNPFKVNAIMDILKAHIKTDMELWEIEKLRELSQDFNETKFINKVFSAGPEGELTEAYTEGKMFILLSKEGNFDRIKNISENIFN